MNEPRPAVRSLLAAVVCLGLASAPAAAQLRLYHLQTEQLRLVYFDEEHEYIIPHLARCFENSLDFYSRLFDYTPNERISVLLQDFDDYGYAGATAIPVNYVTLGIEPFEQVYETSPTNERINWVMSHELLHIVASDQAAPSDRAWRKLFAGKVAPNAEDPVSMFYGYMTAPRRFAPRWYHEGMAVFLETWMAGGYGRALGGYDEMVFRTMVHDGAYFYDVVGLESEGTTTDFQIGQLSYLYGTRFISYLAHRYGPEKAIDWIRRGEDSKRSVRGQFRHVFGASLDAEWKRWIEFEHDWQRANLERVRTYEPSPYKVVSERPLGSVSRAYYDAERRQLYTAINYPGEFAHIAAIGLDDWSVRKIAEVATPALYYVSSLAYDPDSGTLYFTTDNSRQWRDLNAVSVDGGKPRMLLEDFRTGDLAFNRADKSLWGVQHHNGLSRLVRLEPPYDSWERLEGVLELPFGRDLFDIDISPDGEYLTGSLIEISGRQRLVRMPIAALRSGDSGYEVLYEFANYSPANFVYSPDGRYLYGTSYYTGVSNVFRYDFETRQMEGVTNGLTGFFRPLPVSEETLFAFLYTAEGFVPVEIPDTTLEDIEPIRFLGQAIVEQYPVVKEWMLGSPAEVDIEQRTQRSGPYGKLRDVELISVYPIVQEYKDQAAVGVRLNLSEPLGLQGFDIKATFSPSDELPSDEKLHLGLRYSRWPWEVTAGWNRADFYDFFGPTKFSRKGYALGVKYNGVLINDRPRRLDYSLRVAGYGELDTLPDYQNVAATVEEFQTAGFSLDYTHHRRTIGAVEAEKGIEARFNVHANHVADELLPRAWLDFDWGFPLPLDHSSIWLRSSAGASSGARDNPFASFFFGGFGNNWVDHREVKRYRQQHSFPGLAINELGGKNYGRLMVEWTLPPVRFKRLGVPSFYSTWAHLALFTSGIWTDFDSELDERKLWNVGAQLNMRVVFGSNLETTLSIGYAVARESGRPSSDEFMVSLKIL